MGINRFFILLILSCWLSNGLAQIAAPACAIPDVTGLVANTTLNPKILALAMKAYHCARAAGMDQQRLLTIIDYSLPSTQKRLWVIDLKQKRILFNSLVAHGQGSGLNDATVFSDKPETHASSLGLFLTGPTYFGHDGYSLKLIGLDKGFNDLAESREIVIHGAPYVSQDFVARVGRLGRSWGCPAVSKEFAKPLINTIKDGTLVFAYYPNPNWLKTSKYFHCSSTSTIPSLKR